VIGFYKRGGGHKSPHPFIHSLQFNCCRYSRSLTNSFNVTFYPGVQTQCVQTQWNEDGAPCTNGSSTDGCDLLPECDSYAGEISDDVLAGVAEVCH